MKENVQQKLLNADVGKDKKWIYSLVRWVLMHPDASYTQIQQRINISVLSAQGYFRKYNTEDKRAYNREVMGNRYKTDVQYKKRTLFNTRKRRVPYTFYEAEELLPPDMKKINRAIAELQAEMRITELLPRGRPPKEA